MGQTAEIILICLLGLQWLLSWRLARRLRAPDPPAAEPFPTADNVSIIIPARNEAENLPLLLKSIFAQRTNPLEVIVVDDDSEDATAAIAETFGAKVVHPGTPPPGWRGKPWACQSGAAAAGGEYLLFLDADVRLDGSRGLDRLLACHRRGALSLLPWHETGSQTEGLSAFFNLLMAFGSMPRGLVGPSLFIPAAAYEECGGHSKVRGHVLENLHLAAILRDQGTATASATGKGMLRFRMYPSGLRALIDGWTKGFAAGAAATARSTMITIALWISCLFIAAGAAFFSPWLAAMYGLYAAQLWWMLGRIGRFPLWTALLYPLPLLFYVIVFIRSTGSAGKRVTWKGRRIADDAV